MHVVEIEFGSPEFDDALRLRDLVLRKPLGMQFTAEQIAAEYADIHLAVYTSGYHLAGYLSLVPQEEGAIKMRQVAVDPDFQGMGYGRFLVEYSEEFARNLGFSKMVLHAREVAVPFYEKADYHIEGERFTEVGIPHFKMWKSL